MASIEALQANNIIKKLHEVDEYRAIIVSLIDDGRFLEDSVKIKNYLNEIIDKCEDCKTFIEQTSFLGQMGMH